MIWVLLVPAYLLGTFPSAVMVARSKDIDITTVGSNNPGASNVARTMGTRWGVLVFLLDGLKGAVPAATGLLLHSRPLAYGLVAAAVVGHMFPATRGFKGGKGVASMAGAAFVLQPLVSLGLLVLWLVVREATRIASLASIVIMIGLPMGAAIAGAPTWEVAAIVAINLLVMLRHAGNIRRLLDGTELSASHEAH
jgi:glycerol-3-phosphate acyltransferase PlsY